MSAMLSLDELRGLEERWVRMRAPIAGRLRPGLAAGELDSLASATGLRLPAELCVWWGWHDGASTGELARDAGIGPDTPFPSLPEALAGGWEERTRLADQAASSTGRGARAGCRSRAARSAP